MTIGHYKLALLLLMVIPSVVCAWGESSTATTTIEACITHWTEDPCDFPEHQDKCDIKREHNIPVIPLTPRQTTTSDDGDIINYE